MCTAQHSSYHDRVILIRLRLTVRVRFRVRVRIRVRLIAPVRP